MAVRRAPLFDLIGRSPAADGVDAAPPAAQTATTAPSARPTRIPPKPTVRVELKPREPAFTPAADELVIERTSAPLAPFRVSSKALYIVGAAAVVVCVLVFSLGYTRGKRQGERDVEPLLRREPPRVVEPTAEPMTPTFVPDPTPATIPAKQPRTATQPPTTPSTAELDPREAGLNYMYLGDLPQADAQSAADFLQSNGVDAHYIRVDTTNGGAKNPSPNDCRLFTAPGLSAAELKQSLAQRREAEILRLGQVWQKQHRGSSNFSGFGWKKFGA